jgi:hypothetical protein
METPKYKMITTGGMFVTVTRKSDGWDFFLQDEAAETFLRELETEKKNIVGEEPLDIVTEMYGVLFTNPAPISGKLPPEDRINRAGDY